jgi:hypothetical protein
MRQVLLTFVSAKSKPKKAGVSMGIMDLKEVLQKGGRTQ